ncbi:MAG: efflux RND transporter periplasmic adaptor subunit [Chitinophagaceae bacterium]|nr:efflux RND transporter periplasmic adaptor subunit [Chitinophagaceae bacterium]
MSKSLKWILLIVAILVVVFLVFRRKGGGAKIENVATEKAIKRTIIESVSTSGKIYPETEVKVSPDFSGQVTELKVSEGDKVKKGQILARINNRSSIEAPIDGVVLSLKVKKGESVTGNSFSVGTEMMMVADMSVLEVRVDVGENDIIKINIGDSADVEVDAYNNRKFKGVVTRMANSTKGSSGIMSSSNDVTNYEVRIRLDSTSYKDLADKPFPFRPGMNASAEIRTKRIENTLAVPIAAVNARVKGSDKSMEDKRIEEKAIKDEDAASPPAKENELEEIVFVLQKDGIVKKVVVESGIQDINYIEVKKGLMEGDEVVIGPYAALSKNLKDGMKVKVVPKDKLFEN